MIEFQKLLALWTTNFGKFLTFIEKNLIIARMVKVLLYLHLELPNLALAMS
jgi:hypothetical protein